MNTPALPAYLQNRQSQGVAARATSGMGGILPPHISIRGNSFTLVDAAGNQQPAGPVLDACVVDLSDQMNKRYYENDWTPGSDEPPTCWSSNGIGPSRESAKPQSPTCAQCQWNIRGSDTSRISGKPIKACRDELFLALLIPQYPTMLFQLVIPPGSFKNWQAFNAPFSKGGADPSDVLIRFGFQPQVNGVMTFQAAAYIDEATFAAREQALTQKATDALVGRNDVPIAITHQPNTGPVTVNTGAGPQTLMTASGLSMQAGDLQPGMAVTVPPQQPGQFGGAQARVPFGSTVPPAGTTPAATSAPTAGTTGQTEPPKTRTRRTQAQIAADNAAKAAAQAGTLPPGGSAPVQSAQQAQVPFPVGQPQGGFTPAPTMAAPSGTFGGPAPAPAFGQPAAAPQPAGAQFGIQAGQDPNVDPQLASMLATLGTR